MPLGTNWSVGDVWIQHIGTDRPMNPEGVNISFVNKSLRTSNVNTVPVRWMTLPESSRSPGCEKMPGPGPDYKTGIIT